MPITDVSFQEPLQFAAGDTLNFKRSLRDFKASDGWVLDYQLRGGSQAISFDSTPDTDKSTHVILVTPIITATWLPGDYSMWGYAVNAGTGDRYQFYYNDLKVWPNAQAMAGNEPVTTHAQRMVTLIEEVQELQAGNTLLESRVGESAFRYLPPEELNKHHGYWFSVRQREIALERAKQGRPTGLKMKPIIRVIDQSPSVGMFGRGSGYLGW